MWRQYRELKAEAPDALLFFRMGDFYELFGDDATWTAHALELTLTSRERDPASQVPMCGVPVHAGEGYLRRLIDLGKKVAVAEQVEDPKLAKGIVKRAITRIVTPGLAADAVDAHEPAYLVAVAGDAGSYGIGFLDASTGDLRVTEVATFDALASEMARHAPREALLSPGVDEPDLRAALPTSCVTAIDVHDGSPPSRWEHRLATDLAALGPGKDAVAMLLRYAESTLRTPLPELVSLRRYDVSTSLAMDEATRRNLELFKPLRGTGRKGTLVGLLDRCHTAMGGRRLRDWLNGPLLDPDAIRARHDAVEALLHGPRDPVRAALHEVADMERICARVAQGLAAPRELAALRDSLRRAPEVAAACTHPALSARMPFDLAPDVADDIATWLVPAPPATSGEGGLVPNGSHEELDRLRSAADRARTTIAAMEAQLRVETEINSLKLRFNSVFGYYIEVSKANLHKVPSRWHRKQTISTGERYITPELKELEEEVLGADEKAVALEAELYVALRARVSAQIARIGAIAQGLGELDVLAAFAEIAARNRYCRPVVERGSAIEIRGGRHPVVEDARREERFVPNDATLDAKKSLVILTGPNMAGKSTLLRQVALIVLLAQVGSFVPAASARTPPLDRLYVRVGASDDLARGQSTFMVEMAETANILATATRDSLVLLDEIGRGTSTYDGLAIAWAVAEDLHDRVRCPAMFATHYHELAALTETCARVRNQHVAVAEHGDRIVFLRALRDGPASASYGIQCGRIAGLPMPVVARAKALLKQLEKKRPRPEATQLSLFGERVDQAAPAAAPLEDPVRVAVLAIEPDVLSPREAHEALYRLVALAREN
jgi:DNA mismatch repair protein MutS